MDDEVYNELREELRERRDRIHRRLREIHADRQRQDGPYDKDLEDQAIELENEEVLNQLEPATRKELGAILAALERMEEGRYGKCIDCGDEIGTGRLEALPEALRCIECAERAEQ